MPGPVSDSYEGPSDSPMKLPVWAFSCPYCGAPAKDHKGGKGKATYRVIFHLPGCKPAEEWDAQTRTYRIEREMPGIIHGGYV
jgi:hypothetical protein